MSHLIKIKKGLDLKLIGEATSDIANIVNPSPAFAVYPSDYPGFTPKLAKKEGDLVKAGETILFDKSDNDIAIVSPICGKIARVVRGERRKIERIEITVQGSNEPLSFKTHELAKDAIIKLLKQSGLWTRMRQRPYDIIPESGKEPRDIFITAFDSAPLATADICHNNKNFIKGVEILSKLTNGTVHISCRQENVIETNFSTTHIISGPHPAGNLSIQIEKISPINKGETVWCLSGDTVTKIGHLFNTGKLDFSCIVAVTGESISKPQILSAIEGQKISDFTKGNLTNCENTRIISGNVLTGIKVSNDSFLHYPFRQITAIPEDSNPAEFMGWASLSTKKYSFSRCFFSWLQGNEKRFHFDAKINGGERAIIMAGEYDSVFPMDIYAEFLIKAILARDIEKMEQLGIYEVAPEDFALCEFIDTSKLELQKIVREGLDYLRKEMN